VTTISRRRATVIIVQTALLIAVLIFVARAIATHWTEFSGLRTSLRILPGWLALAALVVLSAFALLIAAWRSIIVGWGEHLTYRSAVRIWALSNLGRYLPGKVWSVAGLAVLAKREGVAAWASVGAAIVAQAVAAGSGAAVVAATIPGAASPFWLVAAGLMAAVTVLAVAHPAAVRLWQRMAPGQTLRPLTPRAVVATVTATVLSWLAYGAAFWCVTRGVLGSTALTFGTATGVFTLGYLIGLLAIVVPGGVGVREAVFIGVLTPALGAGNALVVSVASRLLLTGAEVVAALAALALGGGAIVPDGTDAPPHEVGTD